MAAEMLLISQCLGDLPQSATTESSKSNQVLTDQEIIDQEIIDQEAMSPSMQQCYDLLHKTGRAFCVVASVLDKDLRDAVCVFYLITRAVDTFEDDMSIAYDVKVSNMNSFGQHLLDPTWRFTESKDEYATVLENFPIISQALQELPRRYQDVIMERGPIFAHNLVPFIGRELVTMEDLNEYSYNAGTFICISILRLFAASGLEDESIAEDTRTINEFSLFLHKTNVIKDFWKDWNSGKLFWPKDLWSKYTNCPGEFLKPENNKMALKCLNEMICSALEHLPKCLHFMNRLANSGTRTFYAINQVMGIASLELCYNNPEVFTKSVKIPRAEAARIIHCSSSTAQVFSTIRHYTLKIMKRTSQGNSNSTKIREVCLKILNHEEMEKFVARGFWGNFESRFYMTSAAVVIVLSAACWYLVS